MTEQSSFYLPPASCQVPDLAFKWEALFGRRAEGFFVEVGAYDGESFSNTSCLADVGWAGLYIEPIAEFAEKCRTRHAGNKRVSVLNCAASDSAGVAQIFLGDTLTTLVSDQVSDYEKIDWAKGLHRGNSIEVPTARLDSILDEHNVPAGFDVLVIDVEGAEEKVINGFDIGKWQPKVILIELEDEHPDFRNNSRVVASVLAIRQKIESAGYSIYFKDHINSLYIRRDVAERAAKKKPRPSEAPRVSIGLPTYNRAGMLKEAVNSILAQRFESFELVISDNCSPDPEVARTCTEWAENDPRITYIRQSENIGVAQNYLTVFNETRGALFMWASDDDLWDTLFLEQAVHALDADREIAAWMCHIRVIDQKGNVAREIPNLAKFNSSGRKSIDLAHFVADPECLGKANLYYSVFRRPQLRAAIEAALPFFNDWGADMIVLYAFMCRANLRIDSTVYFCKRLGPHEVGFVPVDPRKNIVPWEHAGRYYGAFVTVSHGTPHFRFTRAAVRARYLYDVLYWRIRLRQHAPWRPSLGASANLASPEPVKLTLVAHESSPVRNPADATKRRFIEEFRDAHYIRHNQRRQEHLASLGLRIEGRSVLELGAGIGDHTTFFIDRNCSICVSDGRQELYEIIRDRYYWMRVERLDLENPDPAFRDIYEIVYAYGLLYHLNNPAAALNTMSKWCGDMLLLETGVSANDDGAENLIFEHKQFGSQSISGTGCRPSRKWIFDRLKALFPYVYVTRTQPWHPEFPLDWDNIPTGTEMTRAVFVASRTPLDLPTLTTELPSKQVRH